MLKNSILKLNSIRLPALTTIRQNWTTKLRTGERWNPRPLSQMPSEEKVLFEATENVGIITLNRPKVLNALDTSMVQKIYPTLKEWESSKDFVIIEGMGNKAFCAGGDVKKLVLALNNLNGAELGQEFFRKEYTLNHLIGTYKIPYIAFLNGITMGGGVGLSVHGKYRIATEKTKFAMPETAIGLFPDVGGTYFLPRLNGNLGFYLGLTGFRLNGMDVLYAGIATHYVPSDQIPELKSKLLASCRSDVAEVLNKFTTPLSDSNHEFSLAPYMEKINKYFNEPTVEKIIERLESDNSLWAQEVLEKVATLSPTSLKITLRALQKGKELNFEDCLKMEFRLACACLHKNSDFSEGVRANLITKSMKPNWNPKSIVEVTETYVNQYFKPLPAENELQL